MPSDERWDDFVDLVGREELREYRTNEQRMANRETVAGIIQAEFETEPTDQLLERLTEHGFPNGPLNDLADVVAHEQTRARNLVVDHEDPDAGAVLLPGHPVHFPEFSPEIRRPAPALGEHTEAVFGEVAESQTTLEEWTEGGAFGD